MKAQELIDKAIAFYSDSNNTVGYRGTTCVYYASENAKCGVGCLMSDAKHVQETIDFVNPYSSTIRKLYHFAFDSRKVSNRLYDDPAWQKVRDIIREILPEDLPQDEQITFLECLQAAHDGNVTNAYTFSSVPFLEAFKITLRNKLVEYLNHHKFIVE